MLGHPRFRLPLNATCSEGLKYEVTDGNGSLRRQTAFFAAVRSRHWQVNCVVFVFPPLNRVQDDAVATVRKADAWEMRWPPRAGCAHGTTADARLTRAPDSVRPAPCRSPRPSLHSFPPLGPAAGLDRTLGPSAVG